MKGAVPVSEWRLLHAQTHFFSKDSKRLNLLLCGYLFLIYCCHCSNTRLVNSNADKTLSSEVQSRLGALIQPVQGRQITKLLLNASDVVEAVYVSEYHLPGLFSRRKPTNGVNHLPF